MNVKSQIFSAKLVLLLIVSTSNLFAADKIYRVKSFDGQTTLEITTTPQKQLIYRVNFKNKPLLNWSDLGFQFGDVMAGQNTMITKQYTSAVKEQFPWPFGERDFVQNEFKELTLDCQAGSLAFSIIARVFNGSVAFRYAMANQHQGLIKQEATTFNFSGPHTIYQYNHESVFTSIMLNSLTKTCDFPATLTNGKLYVSIGEAGNDAYTKAELGKGTIANSLGAVFRKDTIHASPTFQTPWRTISVATTAIGLHAFSDLTLKLSPPPVEPAAGWIKPGKLIRSVLLTTQGGLDCIDFAASHNFQYIMYDAGWYGAEFRGTSDPTQVIPSIDMAKVIQHGKEKGIGVILYVNRVALRAKLDIILPLYKKWGVAGLKFGFVDGLSQEGITWLASAIRKVYDHGFILDIHDNYKPTGLSRTFPNLLTQEGIRGDENSPDAFHNTVLPFTRFLAGAADFTFCFPNFKNDFGKNIKVSKGQQLALPVVYFSPLQAMLWYGNPIDYTNEGEIEFYKKVPTVWNESHYLTGEIGQHISVARRNGTTWYVGTVSGLRDWKGTLSLSFLETGKSYKATVYEDDGTGGIRKRSVDVKKGDSWPVNLPAKGGEALLLEQQP